MLTEYYDLRKRFWQILFMKFRIHAVQKNLKICFDLMKKIIESSPSNQIEHELQGEFQDLIRIRHFRCLLEEKKYWEKQN